MALITEKKNQEQELIDAAQSAIEQQVSRGEYSSPWQESLNATIDKILNREKFSYDMNADAFYQQAKDRYIQQGKQAMMDTIGQQSALTGGYGNSWAQTVGQQAYHGYLQGLNDKLLDFYGVARGAYDAETDDLYNQFNLYNDREKQEYARYIDDRDFNEQIRQFLATNPGALPYYKQLLGEGGEVNLEALADSALGIGGGLGFGSGSGGGRVSSSGSGSSKKKTNTSDIVNQIIRGEWGNGQDRKDALKAAGYSDAEIKALQAEVNKKMDGVTTSPSPSGKTPTQQLKDYNTYSSQITNLKQQGATTSELRNALLDAYQKGNIDKSTYEDLKNNLLGGNNR